MELLIKKPKLTSYQKAFLYNKARFTIIEASTKVGKAQTLDSKVYTPDGYKLMKDINVGDVVLHPNGSTTKVVDTFITDNLKMYKVTFNDGSFTKCCENHLWTYTKRNLKTKHTTTLNEINNISKNELRHVKLPKHGVANFTKKDIKIHPYLLGILLSDGSITTSGIKFSSNDISIIERISQILPEKHRLKKLKGYDYAIAVERNATKSAYEGKTLANYLRQLGLLGLKSDEKFIPDVYKYNSKEIRLEVIRGILDGDGYVCKDNQARIEQTSKRLADDIREVIESLGGMVKQTFKEFNYALNKDGKRVLGKSVYRQGIIYHDCSELFHLERKKEKCTPKKKPINRNFKKIEFIGYETGKCISLKSIDGLYLTDNFIVTHNTFSCIWWIFEKAHDKNTKENQNFWWVAPVYSQTKIAFKRLKTKISQTGAYKINESNLTVTCPNGAVIHFKSADKPDNLFGEDVYGIVFDEAPRAKVDAFYALRSTITATGGDIKMIGNFGGVANWMHQLKEKAKTDDQYSYHKVTAWDAVEEGILSHDEIIQAQKDLPPKVFKQLYLAEEQESDDQLVSFDAMADLFTNEHVKDGEMYITADIALHGSDKFVVAVWSGLVLKELSLIGKCDAKEVERFLKNKAEKFKVKRSNITYDADGLGSFLRGYLSGAKPFNNGSKPIGSVNYKNLKSQCGYKLADFINAGKMRIECELDKTELFKELECLQSHALDNEGKMQLLPKAKIKEIIGHSPDILDALLMRMYFELNIKTKVSNSGIL